MGFWEDNKGSITSGLKSAGKYGYQGTKYVAKSGYKAGKKHYNTSKSQRDKKSGKNKSDEEIESDDEEFERKPADIRTLKNPNSFPPPPLKTGQRTYTGQQQQQQMSSGEFYSASQAAYQAQPGVSPMGQPQYAQPQYAQYPQQQQAPVAQQTPPYGPQEQQMPPYGSYSNSTSFNSLPQQNQPPSTIQSQVSLNSGPQQSTGFPSQSPGYGYPQLAGAAQPQQQPPQNNQQYQQQPPQNPATQYGSQGLPNFGQPQYPTNPQQMDQSQQQPPSQFGQQVLPPPVQPQQQPQFPPQAGQPVLPTPGQSSFNAFGQQQQQQQPVQQQQPLNQNTVPGPYSNEFNSASAYGQPMPNSMNMQGTIQNYGAPPMQSQNPIGGLPPVPGRMQPQPPQPPQALPPRNAYQAEPSFDSSQSNPHFEVAPYDPDAPAPRSKIDIPTVDVTNLPPPPTHRDRGAVVKPESTPSVGSSPDASKKALPSVTSSPAVSSSQRNPEPVSMSNEPDSADKQSDESTIKSSILGHYDVKLNFAPPPKPFRHVPNPEPSDHARKRFTPEQKAPALPSRNNSELSDQPSRAKSESTEPVPSVSSGEVQEAPISNFLPPPKPFRHNENQQGQGAGLPSFTKKNDISQTPSREAVQNVKPLLQPESESQFQPRSGPACMETQPIKNFQPPPKPFRRPQQERSFSSDNDSATDNDSANRVDRSEANNSRGRGRIVKRDDAHDAHDAHDADARYKSEKDHEKDHDEFSQNTSAGFGRKKAPTPPPPPAHKPERSGEAAIAIEIKNINGSNNHEKSPSSLAGVSLLTRPPMQASTKKAPRPVVKPKPKILSLKNNEPPRELIRKDTTDSVKGSGQDEKLNSITNELSQFKLRKTNVNLEDLGNSKKLKESSPIDSDMDENYVSASGSVSPPRPPPSRSSATKVPPHVLKKNDNLKKKPPVVPKKKSLLKALEPRPIGMERTGSLDNSDGGDNLNPFERYKRNVVPQEEDRLHKQK
ncbi:hypothetical protein SUVZ_04G3220 [Saccharomyces uvarum]|uniref:Altered inheritance of mitochondria protein 3 n=1 Tax=Saccharomyces uvarum TaxID=230603 RepID=A0ABN8WQZ5_SACUV|nr:hypothetical protein SUVZ_04G3220 [Saccharomyces uvarum]